MPASHAVNGKARNITEIHSLEKHKTGWAKTQKLALVVLEALSKQEAVSI
jgi:hypothetical protein